MKGETTAGRWWVTVEDATAKLPGSGGERFARGPEHGTMDVENRGSRGHDPQQLRVAERSFREAL